MNEHEKWRAYLAALKGDFVKLCRLEFLQPDGSVAFALDNNPRSKRSGAFIQSGSLTVNLQNGQRRNAEVTLANVDGAFDYNVNKLWFGQEVRLSMGLVLPDGEEFYLPQGVFLLSSPQEAWKPGNRVMTYTMVDKWAMLDGTLGGILDGIYEVPMGSELFEMVTQLLREDRGNGRMVDSVPPIYTGYYNSKTTTLPDGSVVSMLETPYTLRIDSDGSSLADVLLGLNTMIAGWIGYDATGALRIDPSQDDILDTQKPVLWDFAPTEKQLLGATYTVRNTETYNDVIICGEALGDSPQANARAQNLDPNSDTNVYLIGRKTYRESKQGYYTDDICRAYAEFKLKRMTVLQKSVTIESGQMFHLRENELVTVRRTDKPGTPVERHLVTGFTLPLSREGSMTIDCTSVQDFPVATIAKQSWEEESG